MKPVTIIGAGLAGCESAWQLATRGVPVRLFEMKRKRKSEAHIQDGLAELVCSNSFRGMDKTQGVGLLKIELERLGSLFMEAAKATAVPAGGALAVDRNRFSTYITEKIRNHPLIEIIDEEATAIQEDAPTIIATGPLTDGSMMEELQRLLGDAFCYFHDGSAPIVSADSLDYEILYFASRYGKGDPKDYLNAPMDQETYRRFYEKLIHADRNIPHLVEEKEKYFDGCMPVEEMARRGEKTLLFGPLKPVGLEREGQEIRPHGVVQLRAENLERTMYNLVGFQTGLTFPAQAELIHSIPGMEDAEILRYGVVHRNSYVDGPKVLNHFGQLKNHPMVFLAGQLSGVEGYVESAASGFVCGIEMARLWLGQPLYPFPRATMLGSIMEYISTDMGDRKLEPMNANYGLLPPLENPIRDKKQKKTAMADASLALMEQILEEL